MPRWWFVAALLALVTIRLVSAQDDPPAPPRAGEIIGLLWHDSPNDQKALVGLKRGLLALGMAGSFRVIDVNEDRELARRVLTACDDSGVRMVIPLGTRATQLARDHVRQTPVVFTAVTNPVLSGILATREGSGRNIAGNSNWLDRREMIDAFRLAVPGLKRLCVVTSKDNPVSRAEVAEAREVLREIPGLQLDHRVVTPGKDLAREIDEAVGEADALWVPIDLALYKEKPLSVIVDRAAAAGVPVVSTARQCAGAGALVTVTVDYEALGLKAASIVKRILVKGEDPGAIPMGTMSSSTVYLDLSAARRIGTRVPLDLVLKAWRLLGARSGEAR